MDSEQPVEQVKAEPVACRQFPILGGGGAKIDWQLVVDHGGQARDNHYQSVERLAERGGLGWCELYAVLHNRKWQKMDQNEAMLACRALEARYLAAIATPQPAAVDDRLLAALQIIANPDWSWMTAADAREHATEALAQIERKPEDGNG